MILFYFDVSPNTPDVYEFMFQLLGMHINVLYNKEKLIKSKVFHFLIA